MLDYTIIAGKRVWRNICLTSRILNIVTQLVSIFFLTYIVVKGNGVLAVNILLLALSCAYFVFFCVTLSNAKKKQLKHTIKQIFKWSKRAVKLVNLGVMVYAILSSKERSTMDLLLFFGSLGFWALDIIFEIASMMVKSWALLIYEGLKADVEEIITPLTTTKNLFKKFTGQEIEEKPAPNKRRVFLDGLVADARTEKAEKKQENKLLRIAQKKAEKVAKKLAKKLPKSETNEEIAPADGEN